MWSKISLWPPATTRKSKWNRAVLRTRNSSKTCCKASVCPDRVRVDTRVPGSPAGQEIERLIQLLAKLPGLGPRSARRAALALLKKRETLLEPLADALTQAASALKQCSICGNLDTTDPCALCADPERDPHIIC